MPIEDHRFRRLTPENVARSPKKPGVFAIYAREKLVYLGAADGPSDTIRTALRRQFAEDGAKVIEGATRYKREPSPEPASRLKILLEEFEALHGTAPSGNLQA